MLFADSKPFFPVIFIEKEQTEGQRSPHSFRRRTLIANSRLSESTSCFVNTDVKLLIQAAPSDINSFRTFKKKTGMYQRHDVWAMTRERTQITHPWIINGIHNPIQPNLVDMEL